MTETLIVVTDRMNIATTVIQKSVILKLNLDAIMANASRNYGIAISMTIVETIQMNQLTCAVIGSVQQVGESVRPEQTIDAFRHGYSVMEKMIAAMVVMRTILSSVLNVVRQAILSVKMVRILLYF